MQLRIPCQKLPLRSWTLKFFWFLPRLILYLSCFTLFYINVRDLLTTFFRFQTTILIKYDSPKEVTFPAITVCGCTYHRTHCEYEYIEDDDDIESEATAKAILQNFSFPVHHIISSCDFIYDSRQENMSTSCADVAPPLASLQDGRKCFTFFSQFNDDFHQHQVNAWRGRQILATAEQFGWHIALKFNMTQATFDEQKRQLNADVVLAIHSPKVVPNSLDVEYGRIEAMSKYTLHYSKQITKLKQAPYNPPCKPFGPRRPRSAGECLYSCLLNTLKNSHTKCINRNFLVTAELLTLLNSLEDRVGFCNGSSYQAHLEYVLHRRFCADACGRDCDEENYEVVSESSSTLQSDDSYSSYVLVKPDRKLTEVIQHSSDMDFYQFVGNLGGHLHLWLGLSAIQLYDVTCQIIFKVQVLWQKFVEW